MSQSFHLLPPGTCCSFVSLEVIVHPLGVSRLASSSSQENFIVTIIGKSGPQSCVHVEALWFYENVYKGITG